MTTVKYIVTDPCYLMPDPLWEECCTMFDIYKGEEANEHFNKKVSQALTDFSGYPADACDTGIGDWSNEIMGDNIIKSDFYADAGMVCVCRLSDSIKQHLKEKYGSDPFYCAAYFEMSEDIKVEFDVTNVHWTVVKVTDNQTGETIQSIEDDEFFEKVDITSLMK